ncbi:MAG: hypothetical protein RLZZ393_648 [Pseudomonadota bacterium]
MPHRPPSFSCTRLLLAFVGLFLAGTCAWSSLTFGEVSFEQFIYHLRFGAGGLLQTDAHTVQRYIIVAVLGPAAATVALALAARRGRWLVQRQAHWLALVAGTGVFLYTFDFADYIESFFGPDLFAQHYVAPRDIHLVPTDRPRSLVLIYVESMEATYQDKAHFGRDLIEPLTRLQRRYTAFPDYPQSGGAHWTIAGIVATQCGVPLKVSILPSPEDDRLHLRNYLPHATCLGDVLQDRGYENVFLNGPYLEFADLGTFLKDHGYTRRYGAREWISAGEDRRKMKTWGLRDDHLFVHAREELTRLVAGGKPFNLTILTVDTHGPEGILSDECRRQGARDFKGILGCSATQVAGFVDFIAKQGWLDRIAVVVQGDHIAMENPLHDTLETFSKRTIYNVIATDPVEIRSTDTITHFDLYPTLLELAGFHPEGGRMGLGYCLLQRCGTPAPSPDRIRIFKGGILNRSPVYESLWTG